MRPTLTSMALAAAILAALCTQAQAGRSRALETGQKISYGAVGDVTAGVDRKYKDSGKVVTDLRTGLTWWKFLLVPFAGWYREEPYSWSARAGLIDTDGETYDGESFDGSAAGLLSKMNTEPCFEGYCDWRLPTVTELFTLVNFGPEKAEAFAIFPPVDGPAITWPFHSICNCENRNMTPMSMMRWAQACAAGFCSCTTKALYWSSTTSPIDPKLAMAVNFGTGEVEAVPKTAWLYVRPVRGPKRPG